MEAGPLIAVMVIGEVLGELMNETDSPKRIPKSRLEEQQGRMRKRTLFSEARVILRWQTNRKLRGLNDTTLGFDKSTPILVNEHVSSHSKHLLHPTVSKKMKTGWNCTRSFTEKI